MLRYTSQHLSLRSHHMTHHSCIDDFFRIGGLTYTQKGIDTP